MKPQQLRIPEIEPRSLDRRHGNEWPTHKAKRRQRRAKKKVMNR